MSLVGSAAPTALVRLSRLLPVDAASLSDLQLVALVEHAEEAARHAEAVKLAAAREMMRRSDASAPDSLAKRLGFKTPAQAIESITKSSSGQARKLVAEAEQLAKLPAVEAAVLEGRIGRDAGAAIVGELKKVTAGSPSDSAVGAGAGAASPAELAAAEEHLVELAATTTADQVRARAHELAAQLTPEVVEQQARKAMAERFFWVSPTKDGIAHVKGILPAGHAAVIRGAIDAYVNPRGKKTVGFVDAETGMPACAAHGDGDGCATEAECSSHTAGPVDTRTVPQKKADVLRDICSAQARAADAPDMGGDHPTVWVTTTATELESGQGLAFYAGSDEPVPVAEATQAACAGGVQPVVFNADGSLLSLGREVRGFTRRQRRAIAARDGGTCLIPGCTIPAQWCEVHHVVAYKDGGPTDASNGVNLCWFHHHEIDTGPWQIRMRHGTPEVRYAFGRDVREWAPAGNGAAARARVRAQRAADSRPDEQQ